MYTTCIIIFFPPKHTRRVPYDNFVQRYGLVTNTRLLAQGDKDDISYLFLNVSSSALPLCNLVLQSVSFHLFAALCSSYTLSHTIGKQNPFLTFRMGQGVD